MLSPLRDAASLPVPVPREPFQISQLSLPTRAVPVFFPRLAPHRGPESGARFTFERWRRNREWEAVLGVLAGFLFLAAKLLL